MALVAASIGSASSAWSVLNTTNSCCDGPSLWAAKSIVPAGAEATESCTLKSDSVAVTFWLVGAATWMGPAVELGPLGATALVLVFELEHATDRSRTLTPASTALFTAFFTAFTASSSPDLCPLLRPTGGTGLRRLSPIRCGPSRSTARPSQTFRGTGRGLP